MPGKGHRSGPHRSSRPDRRHPNRSRSATSDNTCPPSTSAGRTSSTSITNPSDNTPMNFDPYPFSAQSQADFGVVASPSYPQLAFGHGGRAASSASDNVSPPSTSTGRTSSTSITSPPEDTPMNFDPYPFSPQSQPDFGVAAFAPYPQPAFGPPQLYAAQVSHQPTDPDPSYYVAASPEPIDYGHHGDGDDLAASMVVSPGSPPPPRSYRSTMIEEEMTKQESKKDRRTTKGHTKKPSVVLPWRPDPSNVLVPQGDMTGGYQPYDPNLVDAFGYPPRFQYPLAIDEADMYDDPHAQAGNGLENVPVNLNHWHQDGCANQNQEDEWVWVEGQWLPEGHTGVQK